MAAAQHNTTQRPPLASFLIPHAELKGKLNGLAIRVPLLNGSITDCVFEVKRGTSVEEVNALLKVRPCCLPPLPLPLPLMLRLLLLLPLCCCCCSAATIVPPPLRLRLRLLCLLLRRAAPPTLPAHPLCLCVRLSPSAAGGGRQLPEGHSGLRGAATGVHRLHQRAAQRRGGRAVDAGDRLHAT